MTGGPSLVAGLVLRARSGFYTVQLDGGSEVECRMRGRMKRERQSSDLAVIGDRVAVELLADGSGMIASVERRRSRFSRRQPGPRGAWREDVMVANLDLVVTVVAAAHPPPNPRLVDRLLVVAEQNEVDALVVVNKVDLAAGDGVAAAFADYERIGYRVAYVSARSGAGIDQVRAALHDRISVVVGPSGVGKSTLLNALQPGLRLETGEVSEALHKGRHTTRVAQLHRLDGGGYVADTPGIRELGLWEIPADQLAWGFVEFRPHLGACGFNDCSHVHEPRCAVRAAVDAGDISPRRYDSYRRMLAGEDRA